MQKIKLLLLLLFLYNDIKAQSISSEWINTIIGSGSSEAFCNSITTDDTGNVYLTGRFDASVLADSVDFDLGPGVSNQGGAGIFIMKLTAAGNLVWVKRIGSNWKNNSNYITVDDSGNVYTTGGFAGATDFNPGPGLYNLSSTSTETDLFILKLNASGNFVWARKIGNVLGEYGQGISFDNSGNIYLTGTFSGYVDFDPGAGSFGITAVNSDVFILKLNPLGNFVWAKKMGGVWNEEVNAIVTDHTGSVYTVGHFMYTSDFDPGAGIYNLSSTGYELDIFISKLDSNGNFIWAKRVGGTGWDRGLDLKLDKQENVVLTGSFSGIVDFNPGAGVYNLEATNQDAFVLKINMLGNFLWAKQIKGSGLGGSAGLSIAIDTLNNTYLTGRFGFEGAVDFDPGPDFENLCPNGWYDIFISKLDSSGNHLWVKQIGSTGWEDGASIAVDDFDNLYTSGWFRDTSDLYPGTPSYFVNSPNKYSSYIMKLVPCYSINASNLTITTCDNYAFGCSETTSGIYKKRFTNISNCDSIVTLNLTILNSSDSNLYATACYNYTLNSQNYTSSGVYTQSYLNAVGCDSSVILHLTINDSSYYSFNQSACESYMLNSSVYASSGNYIQHLSSAAGCDSTISLNLTIFHNTDSLILVTACDSFASPGGSYNWVTSGIYHDTISNSLGCDSLITIDLEIKYSTGSLIVDTVCFEYNLNGVTYTMSGSYTQQLINAGGCDSIVTLHLTIDTIDVSIVGVDLGLFTYNQTADFYQWINCDSMTMIPGANGPGFDPDEDGNYAVIITENGCTDTSACYPIFGIGMIENNLANAIRVFPNPSSGKVTIFFDSAQQATIQLLSPLGQVIMKQDVVGANFTFDISEQANGFYILEVNNGHEVARVKLIKK